LETFPEHVDSNPPSRHLQGNIQDRLRRGT
jgi:hypothetical protein